MIAPTLLLLTSAAPPPEQPFDLASLMQYCGGGPGEPAADKTELLTGYGQGGFPIRTAKPEAQAFFDNGVQLGHAFAHKASIKAFEEAVRIDPNCAMCAWGEAWSKGPTLNYGVSDTEAAELTKIAARAQSLSEGAPPLERELIAAMVKRYPAGKVDAAAYATAMDALAKAHPDNDAVNVLAAEALMLASSGKDWAAELARPVELLETVLKRDDDYAPAIHFYIHATEIAGYPARAEVFADRLERVAPSASHLVHMPSHTYYWIGRYADAATSNLRAVNLGIENAKRLKLPEPDGVWTLIYHGHNVHFGMGGALMSGDATTGLALARPMIEMSKRSGKLGNFQQLVLGQAFVTVAKFAPVEEMLAIPRPSDENAAAQALWHYARGEALARKGDAKAIRAEARAVPGRLAGDKSGVASRVLRISRYVLEGRAAMLEGRYDRAAKLFGKAAAIEEVDPIKSYSDPPIWWYPVRRDIAAALLAKGDAAGAVREATASLNLRPNDPAALEIRGKAQAKLGNNAASQRDLAQARAALSPSAARSKRAAG
ncbi:hypothetical protein P1X14_04320 [Sphingomonas sp. AOB5]|uniref:tetratricopeptide repeat protein n=1 Tax=Sphingomonas sp. AOB5 TaxID=3034017 RepID=UPI0023F89244|nr:hypothetical protein [Sphingomonas sp. AOB5]MDF7774462.1 hypothetical protein [Sphingomonas sp. AOB5]